jgi:hypothetical protein
MDILFFHHFGRKTKENFHTLWRKAQNFDFSLNPLLRFWFWLILCHLYKRLPRHLEIRGTFLKVVEEKKNGVATTEPLIPTCACGFVLSATDQLFRFVAFGVQELEKKSSFFDGM